MKTDTHTHFPAANTATFNLVIVHGMQEHAARYHEFATFISQQGGNVIVFDLPGHGASGHDPNQVGSFGPEGLHSVFA